MIPGPLPSCITLHCAFSTPEQETTAVPHQAPLRSRAPPRLLLSSVLALVVLLWLLTFSPGLWYGLVPDLDSSATLGPVCLFESISSEKEDTRDSDAASKSERTVLVPNPPPIQILTPALSSSLPPPLPALGICSSCPKSLFSISSLLPTPNPTLLQCSNSYPVPLLYPHSPNPLSCPYSCCTLAPIAISPPSFILPLSSHCIFPVPHPLAGGVFLSSSPTNRWTPPPASPILPTLPNFYSLYLTISLHRKSTLYLPICLPPPQSRNSSEPDQTTYLPTYLPTAFSKLDGFRFRATLVVPTYLRSCPTFCSFSLTEAFA
ncbi:hypothetical protein LY78DRAFT_216005 [Colletotrichum sublineola]|nr:hypothetical protein LY78DRAFT_216005 [Colletotrichum sublineola]